MQKRGRDSSSSGAENTHHNGDFSTYFRNKQIKLDNQAKDSIEQQSSIFAGCVIYITGYTVPSSTQLKQLVVANGGQICAMLGGKTYATHIVATSLTARKREQYANYTVVTPQWVVDCVRSQKRLDWTNYSLFNSITDRVEVSVEQDEETEVANGQQQEDAVPLPTDTENNDKEFRQGLLQKLSFALPQYLQTGTAQEMSSIHEGCRVGPNGCSSRPGPP